jgi:hypothetical protein
VRLDSETELKAIDSDTLLKLAQASAAISLKRITDAQEKTK